MDELCAFYMLCGVPCEEFWNGDYTTLKYYVRCHELRNEQKNQEMWLQGAYILEAVRSVVSNALSKNGKGGSEYPKEPFKLRPPTDAEKEQEKQKMVEQFRNQLMGLDSKFRAKHKGGENK